MAMRMTGLVSGMDTESMVKELVSASSEKVNKIKQKKQDVEWKKEIWSGLNTKIYNFYKTELSAFKTVSSYNAKKAVCQRRSKCFKRYTFGIRRADRIFCISDGGQYQDKREFLYQIQ